jgi:hypothetical protein
MHYTLEVYPTGAYRWRLLVLTLVAAMLVNFDLLGGCGEHLLLREIFRDFNDGGAT